MLRLLRVLLGVVFFYIYFAPIIGDRVVTQGNLCLNTTTDLASLINQSEFVLAGRFRERSIQPKKNPFSGVEYFHASVLVTTRYKNRSSVADLIDIGSFYLPTSAGSDKLGCLDAFYRNSKYVFFLKVSSDKLYELVANPIPFTDSFDHWIYAQQCSDCFAPRIHPMEDQQKEHGGNFSVTCSASGNPVPKVVWVKNGRSLDLLDKSLSVELLTVDKNQVEAVLEIASLVRTDSGEYECVATNPLGKTSKVFNLRVNPPPDSEPRDMSDSELIPCTEANNDYCLHGGQCYMMKSDQSVLQCRCLPQYFGSRCRFHIGDVLAYAETRDGGFEGSLKDFANEVITHLSWSIWGSFALTTALLLYLIVKSNTMCLTTKERKRNLPNNQKASNATVSQYSRSNNSDISPRTNDVNQKLLPINNVCGEGRLSYLVQHFDSNASINFHPRDIALFKGVGHAPLEYEQHTTVLPRGANLGIIHQKQCPVAVEFVEPATDSCFANVRLDRCAQSAMLA